MQDAEPTNVALWTLSSMLTYPFSSIPLHAAKNKAKSIPGTQKEIECLFLMKVKQLIIWACDHVVFIDDK